MSDTKRNRRAYGDGGYRKRGDAWELKFSATDPATGERKVRYVTFKGTESGARSKLRELVKQAEEGAFMAPARQKFSDVLDAWDKTLAVSPKTAERYRELVKLHIRPHLGELRLQAIRTSRIETFYFDLLAGKGPEHSTGGARALSARTIGHIHRLVVKVFSIAERDGLISSNPAQKAKRPKIEKTEIQILAEEQVRDVLTKLRGRNSTNGQQFYRLASLYLATGMRRGEGLALRWKNVDLDGAQLHVRESLEQTKAGLRFKAPKTKHGRRTISLPAFLVSELRSHKLAQAVQRMALGLGKDSDDALVFRQPDGEPLAPENVTKEWMRLVASLELPKVTLHALRHTHASQLIASGMDVLTISRRLGHGSPSITLDVYGHLFQRSDGGAAAVIDRAFGGVQTE